MQGFNFQVTFSQYFACRPTKLPFLPLSFALSSSPHIWGLLTRFQSQNIYNGSVYIFKRCDILKNIIHTVLLFYMKLQSKFCQNQTNNRKRPNQFKLLILQEHTSFPATSEFQNGSRKTNNSNKKVCYIETNWVREKGTSRVLILELKSIVWNQVLTIMVISKSL